MTSNKLFSRYFYIVIIINNNIKVFKYNSMHDECPICLMKEVQCFTECGHGFCVSCVSKIKRCAMCRKKLNHPIICVSLSDTKPIERPRVVDSYFRGSNIVRFMSGIAFSY
jgi:hypothetical protein